MGVRVPSPAPIQTSSGYSNYTARLSLSPRPFLVLEILTIQQKLYESCFNSVAEVARILDVSIKRIYRMAAKGQIPSVDSARSGSRLNSLRNTQLTGKRHKMIALPFPQERPVSMG